MDRVIPASPEDVTDGWLTGALREHGALDGGRVRGHATELLETQGAAGVVARLRLTYEGDGAGAPASLVAKFASPHAPIRTLLHGLGGYTREVEFYRHFGADPGIPVPHCYHADIDSATGMFVLLLEDMGDARVIEGGLPSIEDTETAVRHLATFHAKWWNHPRLRELAFLRYPGSPADDAFMAQGHSALAASFAVARERFGALPQAVVTVVEHLIASFGALADWRKQAFEDSATLVHGDFHPGQMFFPSERGGRFAVFDWQTVSAGSGGDDLARIIVTGMRPEDRAIHDGRLIELYHALLIEHGVTGYDIERCREGFRLGLVMTAAINLIASVNIDPAFIDEFEAVSGIGLVEGMFGWVADAMESHGVLDALPV